MTHSKNLRTFLSASIAAITCIAAKPSLSADTIFTVRQTFSVPNSEKGTVRGWFWMPEDRPGQKVLEFKIIEAPENLQITRDQKYGRSWLYGESKANESKPLKIVTEFKVVRQKISGMADARKAGVITPEHIRAFPAELRRDEKHMEVTPKIQKIADELAGSERNPVLQAEKFFHFVIEKSEHYSKSGPKPKGLCLGSADECLAGSGDCCTDQHALFIALCRARNIPCRLFYGSRLKPENVGKEHDPGYRCWPSFFAPGIGWVPLDISSADTAVAGKAGEWFGGLDENRLEWAEGRDFDLTPKSAERPDLVIRGWVEVNGTPYPDFTRVLHFTSEPAPQTIALK
ncbi:MAG TPA: transglutaminase-like domain-containing protein [Verrucomicrobiae bacterium]